MILDMLNVQHSLFLVNGFPFFYAKVPCLTFCLHLTLLWNEITHATVGMFIPYDS